ncbi:MAG: CoA-transferase, partial [Candidatus Cloacimonadaceae bacterium]|nr:CoA-transferase [Candidatus Cloacimonadaceae bacterium]
KTARNSNPIMAMAGKITIAEVDEIVEIGELDPELIACPGVFVNYIVKTAEVHNG